MKNVDILERLEILSTALKTKIAYNVLEIAYAVYACSFS